MKKSKTQKGITLIALIITIVVLLILAVVAISSIQNDGILSYANNAATTYNQAQKNEQDVLDGYLGYMPGNGGSTANEWTQNGTTVTKGEVTLEVGTVVTGYDAGVDTYTGEWAVLGAENGQLLLVSTTNVGGDSSEFISYSDFLDNTEEGDALYDICNPYGKGEYATGARPLKIEDINRVTGYNPEKAEEGNPYGYNTIYQYGLDVTYKSEYGDAAGEYDASYYSTVTGEKSAPVSAFGSLADGTYVYDSTDGVKIRNTFYEYDISEFTNISLFEGNYFIYSSWESSKVWGQDGQEGVPCFGVFFVSSGDVMGYALWIARPGGGDTSIFASAYEGTRAVVYLESDINIDNTGKIS